MKRRPLRVAIVCGDLRPELDGVAGYVTRLTRELRDLAIDARVVHARPTGLPGSVGAVWNGLALLRAARLLRRADVVHVQFAPSMYRYRHAIGLLPLLLRARRPIVTTLHEYGWWRWAPLPARLWQALERHQVADRETALLIPGSAAVVVTNAAHANELRRRFGAVPPATRIPIGANVEIASPLDPEEARQRLHAQLGLTDEARVVAFFGFVHPVKGVRYLVDAVAALRADGADLHLLLVGGFESLALPGEEANAFERELQGLTEAAGMAAHTTVTGFCEAEEVSRLLQGADIAALPFTAGVTTKSGSLLTVLAHGLPTVITASDDPDLVDGVNCVQVGAVRDAEALRLGLTRVLDDAGTAARLVEGGAELAASRSWRGIAEQHAELYERVRR